MAEEWKARGLFWGCGLRMVGSSIPRCHLWEAGCQPPTAFPSSRVLCVGSHGRLLCVGWTSAKAGFHFHSFHTDHRALGSHPGRNEKVTETHSASVSSMSCEGWTSCLTALCRLNTKIDVKFPAQHLAQSKYLLMVDFFFFLFLQDNTKRISLFGNNQIIFLFLKFSLVLYRHYQPSAVLTAMG